MSHDDNLKKAVEDIKSILRGYDIAGSLALVSKTHSEFLYHFPAWSAVQWNKAGDRLNVENNPKHYANQEELSQRLTQSVHIVMQNRDIAAQTFHMFDTVYESLKEHMNIEHKSFSGFEPHKPPG